MLFWLILLTSNREFPWRKLWSKKYLPRIGRGGRRYLEYFSLFTPNSKTALGIHRIQKSSSSENRAKILSTKGGKRRYFRTFFLCLLQIESKGVEMSKSPFLQKKSLTNMTSLTFSAEELALEGIITPYCSIAHCWISTFKWRP